MPAVQKLVETSRHVHPRSSYRDVEKPFLLQLRTCRNLWVVAPVVNRGRVERGIVKVVRDRDPLS